MGAELVVAGLVLLVIGALVGLLVRTVRRDRLDRQYAQWCFDRSVDAVNDLISADDETTRAFLAGRAFGFGPPTGMRYLHLATEAGITIPDPTSVQTVERSAWEKGMNQASGEAEAWRRERNLRGPLLQPHEIPRPVPYGPLADRLSRRSS